MKRIRKGRKIDWKKVKTINFIMPMVNIKNNTAPRETSRPPRTCNVCCTCMALPHCDVDMFAYFHSS